MGSVVSLFLSNAIFMRAFTPALATSILALGIDRQVAKGQLVWVVLGIWAALLAVYTRTLPDLTGVKKDEAGREMPAEATVDPQEP